MHRVPRRAELIALVAAVELQRKVHDVYRRDAGWEAAAAAVEQAKAQPWFEAAQAAGVGLRPRDSWKWYARLMDYDPVPHLEGASMPIPAGRYTVRAVAEDFAGNRAPRGTSQSRSAWGSDGVKRDKSRPARGHRLRIDSTIGARE
jgi:hypothetical protein